MNGKRLLIDTFSIGTGSVATGTPFMFFLVRVNFAQYLSWVGAVFLNVAVFGWAISKWVDYCRKRVKA